MTINDLLTTALVALLLALAGCEQGTVDGTHSATATEVSTRVYEGDGPLSITCTVGMLADIAIHVGGDRVTVTSLMGPGTDPHLYLATAGDRKKLKSADIIFYCGNHLEGKMGEVLARFAQQIPTLAVCEQVDDERLLSSPTGEGRVVDPHLWFDVTLWMRCTEVVRDALCEFDPGFSEDYRLRATAYRDELVVLHEYVTTRAREVPENQRVLVTAHDAFGYFGKAYGFEVLGIQGLSTDSEPAVRRINELVDTIVTRGIRSVFVESTISEKNVRSLVEGCRARGHELSIGGSLYSDAMGGARTPAGTYVGMVRHNIDTIVEALR